MRPEQNYLVYLARTSNFRLRPCYEQRKIVPLPQMTSLRLLYCNIIIDTQKPTAFITDNEYIVVHSQKH